MRRMSGCRACVGTVVALLAWPALLLADPFVERPIPLPWPEGHDVAIADFNGDGLADVATLDSTELNIFECYPPPGPIDCGVRMLLTVSLNEGNGQFAPVGTTPAMCLPWTMAAGDFDADGRTDLIIGNRGARDAFGVCFQPSASFYPGTGDGGFGTPQHLILADEPLDMAAGDFDGDGIQEVAMVVTLPGGLHILRVTGGVFTDGPTKPFTDPLTSVAAGDLGGAGSDDIVVAYGNLKAATRLRLVLGTLLTGESCGLPGPYPAPASVLVADLAGDATPEIAAGRPGPYETGGSAVTLLRRGATGSYCAPADALNTPIGAPYGTMYGGHLAAADLDFDGLRDLATTDGVSQVVSLLGDGGGHFVVSAPRPTSGPADQIASGDLDGNGIDDLAVTGTPFLSPSESLVLLNQFPGPGLMLLGMEGDDVDWHGVVDALSYDVVRGDIGALRASGGDYTAALEGCVAEDLSATAFAMPDAPPVGKAWWILGRANLPGGPGTYDEWGSSQVGQRDAGINASALACH